MPTFTGSSPLVDKTNNLLKEVIKSVGKAEQNIKQTSDSNPPTKKAKVDDVGEWIKVGQESLKMSERHLVSDNEERLQFIGCLVVR